MIKVSVFCINAYDLSPGRVIVHVIFRVVTLVLDYACGLPEFWIHSLLQNTTSQHADTGKNTKAWAVSQHTDTSKNTKAWAVSQHTDISKNTKTWAVSQHIDTYKDT